MQMYSHFKSYSLKTNQEKNVESYSYNLKVAIDGRAQGSNSFSKEYHKNIGCVGNRFLDGLKGPQSKLELTIRRKQNRRNSHDNRPSQWRHVPGKLNPADLATKGTSGIEIDKSKFWTEGSTFLKNKESTWPEKLPNNRVSNNRVLPLQRRR